MANLATIAPNNDGTYPALTPLVDTSNSVQVGNGNNVVLLLENSNAAPRTVDIVVAGSTEYGAALPDRQYTLDATDGRLMIPIRRAYADPNTPGRATFTVSAVDGVSAAVVKVG